DDQAEEGVDRHRLQGVAAGEAGRGRQLDQAPDDFRARPVDQALAGDLDQVGGQGVQDQEPGGERPAQGQEGAGGGDDHDDEGEAVTQVGEGLDEGVEPGAV